MFLNRTKKQIGFGGEFLWVDGSCVYVYMYVSRMNYDDDRTGICEGRRVEVNKWRDNKEN